MRYLGYSINCGEKNMLHDAEMLKDAINNKLEEPLFRLYGWHPACISLGKNQKDDFLGERLSYVRRLTGGRALFHDDEVTYCYVGKEQKNESVIDSYKKVSGILIDFFKTLGIELEYGNNKKVSTNYDYCMLLSTGADICYKGKKIIGSAQCRKNGYIMQHGSILFSYDKSVLEAIFREKVEGITTVNEILPDITKEDFVKKLEEFIAS